MHESQVKRLKLEKFEQQHISSAKLKKMKLKKMKLNNWKGIPVFVVDAAKKEI